ncbi:MAG TPA: hypothetical protein VF170_12655, partial [Planctomycetaceae bacterium]
MDQNKRLVLFLLVTGLVWFGWFGFVQPRFFPVPKKNAPAEVAEADAGADDADADDAAPGDARAAGGDADAPAADLKEPNNPARKVTIGSEDPASGYFQLVTLDSAGAAVASIALNDDRYKDLAKREEMLKVVGETGDPAFTTFQMKVAAVDEQLAAFRTDTTRVDWKVEEVLKDEAGVDKGVVFTLTAPDGSVELVKKYSLRKVKDGGALYARDTNPEGYLLDVSIGFRNLTDRPQTLAYTLQGPEGLPLENRENTSKYRDLELGFFDEEGEVNVASLPATDVTEKAAAAAAAQEAAQQAAAADRRLRAKQKEIAELEAQVAANPNDAALKTRLANEKAELAAIEDEARARTDEAQQANRGLERWKAP